MDSLTSRFQKEVFLPYLEFLRSGYRFHPMFGHAQKIWEEKLTAEELVHGPFLEKAQTYQDGEDLERLDLHEATRETVRRRLAGRRLWRHQTDALESILAGNNTVVATGTSSGKTLCYQIPILDDLLRDPSPGLRAVIVYPLNALVNDQLAEWERILREHPGIYFARFTGQTPATQAKYIENLKDSFREELVNQQIAQQELQRSVARKVEERLRSDIPNKLNHCEAIHTNPPQILITNFSMLEYLLERPIDAPIFKDARLKFVVLDEAHAYRGVQATEIAFLMRRLKDRLGVEKLTGIITSATLGKRGDAESEKKVRRFASDLFREEFSLPNPIYGTVAEPNLQQPAAYPSPAQYVKAAEFLRSDSQADIRQHLGMNMAKAGLASVLGFDGNLYRLRKEILTKPVLLNDAAGKLWPGNAGGEDGLQALLEIVASAKTEEYHEDLLATRLHYFVKAQDGLHICLHKECPGRRTQKAAYFVSRKNSLDVPEGNCPECHEKGRKSKLAEVVSCRKCGYLYGALQDLGPRRAQNPEGLDGKTEARPYFDSFSTELGWAADSYWSYFSVEGDLPYPNEIAAEEDDVDQDDLLRSPAELDWCVVCGKKRDDGDGDNCTCSAPHLRKIRIFHRQCPHSGRAEDRGNLYSHEKALLPSCPNCGARNGSGIEPVHRFQESDDEMGLAMAIPLAHFQVTPIKTRASYLENSFVLRTIDSVRPHSRPCWKRKLLLMIWGARLSS